MHVTTRLADTGNNALRSRGATLTARANEIADIMEGSDR